METFRVFIKRNLQIIKDFTLNILSSIILVFATQIIIYPFLSRELSSSTYGVVLTVMGAVNAVGGAFGNALDNTRILLNGNYERKKLVGDYNILFIVISIVDIFVIYLIAKILLNFSNIESFGITIISFLVLFRSYYTVGYRIKTQYLKYLYTSVWALIGYFFGLFITIQSDNWIYSFVFGELFACIYVAFTSKVVYERLSITSLFSTTVRKYLFILGASIIASIMAYMDRFFIYPILGFEQVAIYNVATFLGKMIGIIVNPISGVLLTYYSKEAFLTINKFYSRLILLFVLGMISHFMIIIFGHYIIDQLYPSYSNSIKEIFPIANASVIIFMLGNTLQPTLLKFCSSRWQPIIQIFYLVIYISLGLYSMKNFGLLGFCYSTLIVNILKILIMIFIVQNTLIKNNNQGLI